MMRNIKNLRQLAIMLLLAVLASSILVSCAHRAPQPPAVKPDSEPEPEFDSKPESEGAPVKEGTPKYEYYVLIDEETGQTITYVSSVKVNTGDEYLSGDNTRYIVTRVEENRAYMRSFGKKVLPPNQ